MLDGIMTKRQKEQLERYTYLSQEYGQDMKDTYYYYKDDIEDIWDEAKNDYIEKLCNEYGIK